MEHADLKLAMGCDKVETIGDFDKDSFGVMARVKA